MFEEFTYEAVLDNMLSKVNDSVDKREGSIIYDALAPAAMEMSNLYSMLDIVLEESFADTASYYYLVKRAAERGIYPYEGTKAIAKLVVEPIDCKISSGDRFSINDVIYTVTSDPIDESRGKYRMACEETGSIGNQKSGLATPVEEIEGLENAWLMEILEPGEDEEDTEDFRDRYYMAVSDKAFGGNVAEYIQTVCAIPGVGGCRVQHSTTVTYEGSDITSDDLYVDNDVSGLIGRIISGKISAENLSTTEEIYKKLQKWARKYIVAMLNESISIGGHVSIVVVDSNYRPASAELINKIKSILDPNPGQGEGLAPIGHNCLVDSARYTNVKIKVHGTYDSAYIASDIQQEISKLTREYFTELIKDWINVVPCEADPIIIRPGKLESILMDVKGMTDITKIELSTDDEWKQESVKLLWSAIPYAVFDFTELKKNEVM